MEASKARNIQLLEDFFKLYYLFMNDSLRGEINLPQIVVLGKQSCGKSSIIANIIGVDLMPSGEGTTTKACIRYQIHHENVENTYYIVQQNLRTEDPQAVRNEVERISNEAINEETKQRAEKHNSEGPLDKIIITEKEIVVDIYTKDKSALSCLDLPGMIQDVEDGIEKNTKERIEAIVERSVRMTNTIILFVHDSDEDVENSAIRKMIKKHDPKFERTITVLSKIDLGHQNKWEYVLKLLDGSKFKTPLGYFAMKGRGKEERLANQTIEGAIAAETEWFSNRSEYDDVATRCGTENVRNWLQNILCNWVIDNLQNVEEEILSTYERYRKRFSLLSIPDEWKTEEDASEVIFSAITGITREFHNWMENGNPDDVERVLSGGAYVKYIIKESYDKHIKPLDCLRNYTDEMIYTIEQNFSGHHERILSNDGPSVYLLKHKIREFEAPLKEYALNVKTAIKSIIRDIIQKLWGTKYRLASRFEKISKDILNSLFSSICEKICEHISMERNNINLDRQDFKSYMGLHDKKEMQLQTIRSFMTNQGYSGYIDQSFVDKIRNYYISLDNSLFAQFESSQTAPSSTYHAEEEIKLGDDLSNDESTESMSAEGRLFDRVNDPRPINRANIIKKKSSPSTIKVDLKEIPKNEESDIEVTKKVVNWYWNALKKEFHDMMPRLCKHYFINKFQNELEKSILRSERQMNDKIGLASDPQEVIDNYNDVREALVDLEESLEKIKDLRASYE